MTETSPEDRTKLIHRIGGLLGWFVVNGLIWLILLASGEALEIGIPLFFVNLIVLLFLILNRSTVWIGQGILIAWGINFGLSLVGGAFFNGLCLIPFFNPIY